MAKPAVGNILPLDCRLSDRTRQLLNLAEREVESTGAKYMGPEHLLLAILMQGSSVAYNVLKDLNFNHKPGEVRRVVMDHYSVTGEF